MSYKNLDIDRLIYRRPRKTEDGKYLGKVLYKDDYDKLIEVDIDTQYLRSHNGIQKYENRWYFELELDPEDRNLYNFFSDLDDTHIRMAYENSESWFGKQLPLDIVDNFYRPFIRLHSQSHNPCIKIQIPIENKRLMEYLRESDFENDNLISVDLHFNGLRFYKQNFISDWTLTDYRVKPTYEFDLENNDEMNDEMSDEMNDEEENNLRNSDIIEEYQDEQMKLQENTNENNNDKEDVVKTENIDEVEKVEQVEQVKDVKETVEKDVNKEIKKVEQIDNVKEDIKKDINENKGNKENVKVDRKRRINRPVKKKKIIRYSNKSRVWK